MTYRLAVLFLFLFAVSATGQSESKPGKPESDAEIAAPETLPQDSDVKILSKPNPRYPDRIICVQGTVRLKVDFLASGEIGRVFPVTQLPPLTESAIEAAKKIKFIPKRVNGKNVSIVKIIEYRFGIY